MTNSSHVSIIYRLIYRLIRVRFPNFRFPRLLIQGYFTREEMKNYLMWISGLTKIEDFVSESYQLGICRKLPFLPRELNQGSKIYLASLQIKHVRDLQGKIKHQTDPVIFGEFTVDHIEFIVNEINPVLQDKFSKRGLIFQQITKHQTRKEPRRIEGKRLTAGTIYVVNYPPDNYEEKIKERHGVFTLYDPCIEAKGLNFFRGVMEFDIKEFLAWLNKQKAEEKEKKNVDSN